MPSLAQKPYQEYPLQSENQRRADDIEFARLYNDTTTDGENGEGKFYAIRLTLTLTRDSTSLVAAEVLLYNSLIRLDMPLLQYLGNAVMSDDLTLSAQVNNIGSLDEIIISGSYSGNINYSFDTGIESVVFPVS